MPRLLHCAAWLGVWAFCAVPALAQAPAPSPAPAPFSSTVREMVGVNTHNIQPPPEDTALLAGAFHVVRTDLIWKDSEKTKGVYDFRRADDLMASLARRHLRALLILAYDNPLYGPGGKPPYDAAGRAAFARWAVAAVRRYQGKGVLWELWNEPNGAWFWPNPSAADYSALALTVDGAIRDACPGETLIGPAASGVDLGFLEGCFKAGCLRYWDAVSVHPYRSSPPETAAGDIHNLQALIARYAPPGRTIPVLSGEWGYSFHAGRGDNAGTAARKAAYLPRMFLSDIAAGVPLSIWYDWLDDEGEHMGVAEAVTLSGKTTFRPEAGYAAGETLVNALGDCRFDRRLTVGDPASDYALEFADGKGRRWTAWTTADPARRIVLPLPPGRYTLIDGLGQRRTAVTASGAGLAMTLTGMPQYVVPAGVPVAPAAAPQPYSAFPDAAGTITLTPIAADLHGTQIRTVVEQSHDLIGYWSDPAEYATWEVLVPGPASFRVSAEYSTNAPTAFDVTLAGQRLTSGPVATKGYQDYATASLGTLRFPSAGRYTVTARAHDPTAFGPLNIRAITLNPLK